MVGGAPPHRPPNLTGFLLNDTEIAQDHVQALLPVANMIAVLYDPTNTPSATTYTAITTPGLTPFIPANRLIPLQATTYSDIRGLNLGAANGFMLLPNATYYEYFKDIVRLVDGNVATIYYPEREYKRQHRNRTTGVHVHGHSIPLAYRRAALYVDSISSGEYVVGTPSFPPLTEAITDDT